ncbi:hypothetical protein LEP1GSC062_3873 [Leptospira alexanderi serovar Manhao 3 str. L 60]|uniref:Uncharacterized protein n=1 Tax=Leptospira alexanderi serovar Manhao 3 str. L 60 TaxID=1049759 RepID=V6I8U4_9LEPT|nr:hypothetical protein LEP1GSC062_3873 [Leptospira alexanderi serovar Manhao 3 str. L 60]
MENCYISDCHIESIVITERNIDRIVFKTNYEYGGTLSSEKCSVYVQTEILKNQ